MRYRWLSTLFRVLPVEAARIVLNLPQVTRAPAKQDEPQGDERGAQKRRPSIWLVMKTATPKRANPTQPVTVI